jgi:hypothetical protein
VYLFVFLFFLFSPSRYVFCGPKAPVGVFHEEQSTVLHLLLQEEGNQGHMYIWCHFHVRVCVCVCCVFICIPLLSFFSLQICVLWPKSASWSIPWRAIHSTTSATAGRR